MGGHKSLSLKRDPVARAERKRESERIWYANRSEETKVKDRETSRKWYAKNIQRLRAKKRKFYTLNRERILVRTKEWAIKNPIRFKEIQKRTDAKSRTTIKGRLSENISRAIRGSLANGGKYNRHWESLVDFSLDELKTHLEKEFLPGMSWENRKEWHIDHKIPISAFNFSDSKDIDFKRCWSLENLRPLWALENISKKNKLQKPFQPALALH